MDVNKVKLRCMDGRARPSIHYASKANTRCFEKSGGVTVRTGEGIGTVTRRTHG